MRIATATRRSLASLTFSLAVALAPMAACTSDSSTPPASDAGSTPGTAGAPWPGDPCSLLGDADFGKLSMPAMITSRNAHNVGHAVFSPECHFYLQNQDGTSGATVAIYVDQADDFELQKSIFKGTSVAGLGKAAWQGDAMGQGNSTVDVLLQSWSFRVDSTYEYGYADLTLLAKAIAARLK